MLKPDIPVGLGCDGFSCNVVMDILREMKLALLLTAVHGDPLLVPKKKKVIEMTTSIGASALDEDHEIGSKEAGQTSDFIPISLLEKSYAQLLSFNDCLLPEPMLTMWSSMAALS